MKSLISGTIILLALYAQACCANEPQTRLLLLSSSFNDQNEQISHIQPTLLIPLANSQQYELLIYSRLNRQHLTNNHSIQSSHTSQQIGFGLHRQFSSWMNTQLTIQQGRKHFHAQSQEEILFNLNADF